MDEWSGYVENVGRKYFWARLRDDGGAEYQARIPIARVTKRDRNVFGEGAIFTVHFGIGRPYLRFSHRRWTKAMIAACHERADEMATWMRGGQTVSAEPK